MPLRPGADLAHTGRTVGREPLARLHRVVHDGRTGLMKLRVGHRDKARKPGPGRSWHDTSRGGHRFRARVTRDTATPPRQSRMGGTHIGPLVSAAEMIPRGALSR